METNLGQQTPKLPKINVTNVSSAVFGKEGSALGKESNIGKLARIVRTTRIKVNTIEKILPEHQEVIGSTAKKTFTNAQKITSIKNILKNQKSKIGEKLSGSNTDNFNNTLIETNRILVEIQKQLAYDFAMRIAERDEENKKLKEEQSKKRFKKEESVLEKSRKKIGGALKKTAEKTVAPLKNIFEKIKDFLVIVSLGIATNTIFDFLSKEENRKKLSEWFDLIAKNWKWIGAGVLGLLALKPIFGILGTIGGIIALFRTAVDVFRLARRIVFGKKPPAPTSTTGGTKPPVGDPGRAGGQSGGFKDPNRYRKPGQTRAGSSFQLEQARKGAPTPGSAVPKGGIFRNLRNIKIGKTNLALIGLQLVDAFMPKISGGRYEDLSDVVGAGAGKVGIGVRTYSNEKLLKEYRTLRESYDKGIEGMTANPVPGIDPMILMGSFEDYEFGYGKGLVREIKRRGLSIEQRIMGGPIMAGKPYLVGEGGPELIVPKISGTVINNMKTEKIYQMISSGKKGRIKMITLPPQIIEGPKPKVQMPLGAATKEPKISSSNFMDGYRSITSEIYGITV